MKPKYAIVRVDGRCPRETEMNWEIKCEPHLHCDKCKIRKNYGDTKEQLVRKIAQVIFKTKVERYIRVWKCECSEIEKRDRYKDSLVLAKEIVEFLGVEE